MKPNNTENSHEELQTRLALYKQKKREEKVKRMEKLEKKKVNKVLDVKNTKVRKVNAKNIANKSVQSDQMRERLKMWKQQKENSENKKAIERRNTIVWSSSTKCIPQIPEEISKRKSIASFSRSMQHKSLGGKENQALMGKCSSRKEKLATSGRKSMASILGKQNIDVKPGKSTLNGTVENSRLNDKNDEGSLRRTTLSSTPANKKQTSTVNFSAISTLSTIRSVSSSLQKKPMKSTSDASVLHPRSRKSLFEEKKSQVKSQVFLLPKTPMPVVKSSGSHTYFKRKRSLECALSDNNQSIKRSFSVKTKTPASVATKSVIRGVSEKANKNSRSLSSCNLSLKRGASDVPQASSRSFSASTLFLSKSSTKTTNKQFKTVSSKIDTGLKFKTVSGEVHNRKVSIPMENGIKMNKTTLQRLNKFKKNNNSETTAVSKNVSSKLKRPALKNSTGLKVGTSQIRNSAPTQQPKKSEGLRKPHNKSNVKNTPTVLKDAGQAMKTPSSTHVRFLTPKSKSQLRKNSLNRRSQNSPRDVMREKLYAWLKEKGRTPSKFKHLMCFNERKTTVDKTVKGGLSVGELYSQQSQLEKEEHEENVESPEHLFSKDNEQLHKMKNLLSECLLLLESGCPTENVRSWVEEIEKTNKETIRTESKYYIVRARTAEIEGTADAKVVDIFEQAVRNNAEPPDEVAAALTEFVTRMNERKEEQTLNSTFAMQTPRKSFGVEEKNMFDSSVTRYSLSKATPFFTRLRAKADGLTTPCGMVTPVRRSTRLSKTPLPSAIRNCDVIVESLDELSPNTRDNILFRTNKALLEDFDAAV